MEAAATVCRLADFGLSRMLDLNKTHVSTQTYGTLPFMPVELLSEGHMGKSADVSTASCLLHCVITIVHIAGARHAPQLQCMHTCHACITCWSSWLIAVCDLLLDTPGPCGAQVYSFAVVMWSLMTGDQPHHGMNTMQVRCLQLLGSRPHL